MRIFCSPLFQKLIYKSVVNYDNYLGFFYIGFNLNWSPLLSAEALAEKIVNRSLFNTCMLLEYGDQVSCLKK